MQIRVLWPVANVLATAMDGRTIRQLCNICNSAIEPLSTHIIPDYDHNNFMFLIVLIAFYRLIFLPQHVLNINYETEGDLK